MRVNVVCIPIAVIAGWGAAQPSDVRAMGRIAPGACHGDTPCGTGEHDIAAFNRS